MRPLSLRTAAGGAARSMSPLMHQQRRVFSGSSGGGGGCAAGSGRGSGSAMTYAGDDDVLSWEQADAVQRSWRRANNRIEQFGIGADRCFAFYAFDRIFERAPELKPLFGISPSFLLTDLDEQEQQQQQHMHPFMRHLHVFNNILDLSVRNAAELKTEMLPALFTYGQRHYQPKLKDEFGERTVRLFCSQVVGTMCDLLADDFSPTELEAWIEMEQFGGFEWKQKKRESTNGGNHSAGLNAISGETNSGDQRRGSGASIGFNKHKAHKVDSRKITHKKRLERGQTTTISDDKSIAAAAADHRASALKFFRRANECKFARSLDRYNAKVEPHNNYRSFTFGQSPFNSLDSQSDAAPFGGSSSEGLSGSKKALEPPRIEINGAIEHCCAVNGGENTNGGNHSAGLNANSVETNSGDQRRGSGASIGFNKHKAHKVDSRKITHKKRLERGQIVHFLIIREA
uniref:GLOBIN domain-containing protein n=1 Tax=Globodera pallida TaxID=36090 RepID=A0A183BR62_GLOPA